MKQIAFLVFCIAVGITLNPLALLAMAPGLHIALTA